jgi:hypothetical protein
MYWILIMHIIWLILVDEKIYCNNSFRLIAIINVLGPGTIIANNSKRVNFPARNFTQNSSNEQSWASRPSAKNEQFPLSCPRAAPPWQSGAIGRSSIVTTLEGKSLVYCVFPLISCQPHLGTRPGGGLGETQIVTTHRQNSGSWMGG